MDDRLVDALENIAHELRDLNANMHRQFSLLEEKKPQAQPIPEPLPQPFRLTVVEDDE